jgi:hypothetical protein
MFSSFVIRFMAVVLVTGSLITCQKADSPTPATTPTSPNTPTVPTSTGPYQGYRLVSEDVRKIFDYGLEKVVVNGKTYYLSLLPDVQIDYGYDSQGRITSETQTESGLNSRTILTTYAYGPSSLERGYYLSEKGGITNRYTGLSTLNSAGYIVSDSLINVSSTTYAYDANGYMIRQRKGNTLITREINNGNMVKQTTNNQTYTTYSYDLTKPSQPAISNLLGKVSLNLLIREETVSTDFTGTRSNLTNYSYEFDSKGRVSRRITSIGTDPTPTEVSKYTYSAN